MPVSHALQDIIGDLLSPAIAERKPLGHADLIALRRTLTAIATDAAATERSSGTERFALAELVGGITIGVADVAGLAARAAAVVQAGAAK